jgi:hypothetical protein
MKIKTSELTGAALDWAVAKCEGDLFESAPTVEPQIAKVWPLTGLVRIENGKRVGYVVNDNLFKRTKRSYADEGGIRLFVDVWGPSTDWSQGGPIIERAGIFVRPKTTGDWRCWINDGKGEGIKFYQHGPTPLIAAMRCYVASKLGDEIEIPEELK